MRPLGVSERGGLDRIDRMDRRGKTGIQSFPEAGEDVVRVLELAFPHHQHLPTQAAQLAQVLSVVRDIPREFVGPEFPVGLGDGGHFAVPVPVPETAVDKDHSMIFGQDNVRLAGEVLHVEPEAVARAVKQAADGPLRAGVLAPDLRHVPAAFGFRKSIHHGRRIACWPVFHNETHESHEKGPEPDSSSVDLSSIPGASYGA